MRQKSHGPPKRTFLMIPFLLVAAILVFTGFTPVNNDNDGMTSQTATVIDNTVAIHDSGGVSEIAIESDTVMMRNIDEPGYGETAYALTLWRYSTEKPDTGGLVNDRKKPAPPIFFGHHTPRATQTRMPLLC